MTTPKDSYAKSDRAFEAHLMIHRGLQRKAQSGLYPNLYGLPWRERLARWWFKLWVGW